MLAQLLSILGMLVVLGLREGWCQDTVSVPPFPIIKNQDTTFTVQTDSTSTIRYSWSETSVDSIATVASNTDTAQATFKFQKFGSAKISVAVFKDSANLTVLSNHRMTVLITDPAVDTDLDGIPDSLELALNTNPNDAASTPIRLPSDGILRNEFSPYKAKFRSNTGTNDSIKMTFTIRLEEDVRIRMTSGEVVIGIYVGGHVELFTITLQGRKLVATPATGGKNHKLTLVPYNSRNADFAKNLFTGLLNVKNLVSGAKVEQVSGFESYEYLPVFVVFDNDVYAYSLFVDTIRSSRSGVISGKSYELPAPYVSVGR